MANGWVVHGAVPAGSTKRAYMLMIRESGFLSAAHAAEKGRRVLDALMLETLRRGVGIDLGERTSVPQVTGPVIPNGLSVGEDGPNDGFIWSGGSTSGTVQQLEPLVQDIERSAAEPRTLSPRHRIACELLHAVQFQDGAQARFLLAVAAVEALLELPERDEAARAFVKETLERLAASTLTDDDKASMRGSLRWLYCESISRTGKLLSTRLLNGAFFLGLPPDKFFGRIYTIRSRLLHGGDAALSRDEFDLLAFGTDCFARSLLAAHINEAQTLEQPPAVHE